MNGASTVTLQALSLSTFCKHLTLSQYILQRHLFSLFPSLLSPPFSPLVPATHFDPHPVFSSVWELSGQQMFLAPPFLPSGPQKTLNTLAAASHSNSASPHSFASQPNGLAGGSSPLWERMRSLCVLT